MGSAVLGTGINQMDYELFKMVILLELETLTFLLLGSEGFSENFALFSLGVITIRTNSIWNSI